MVKAKELDSLPERSLFRKTELNGVVTLEFKGILPLSLDDDDVLAFIDKDERRMSVGCDEEGAFRHPI